MGGGRGSRDAEAEDKGEETMMARTTITTSTIAKLMTSVKNSSANMYLLMVPDPSTITQLG